MSITPHIKFRYSFIYDVNWQGWLKATHPEIDYDFPSPEEVKKYIEDIEPLWREKEYEVLTTMSEITQLPWQETDISCWVVGRCRPFSDPLTMRIFENKDNFIRNLIHEMIHQNFSQGRDLEGSQRYYSMIREKYQGESRTTKSHIPVHAFLKDLLLRCFDQTWVDMDIKFCQNYPDYKRAWEIVEAEGSEKIIQGFLEGNSNIPHPTL